MKAILSSANCQICLSIPEDPITCKNCGNNFCFNCGNKEKKRNNCCPNCKNRPFEFIENKGLKQVFKNMIKICDFCKKEININEIDEHKQNCKIYSCNLCDGTFYDEKIFYDHYFQDQIHKELIEFYFDKKKIGEKIPKDLEEKKLIIKDTRKKLEHLQKVLEKAINNEGKKKGKIYEDSKEIHPYLNLVQNGKNHSDKLNTNDEMSQIKIPINPPPYVTLNQFMDLYYCGSQTNFICEYNVCAPGSFLCPRCMRLNQKYHGLKSHYLINAAGRVSRCIKGKYQCNCEYLKIVKSNNNIFYNKNNCNNDFLCDACYELNNIDILKQYLPEEFLYKVLNN